MVFGGTPDFLFAHPGDLVVVEEDSAMVGRDGVDWWVGHVIHVVGGARDPDASTLFQVACIDTGVIRVVNADLVKGILRPKTL